MHSTAPVVVMYVPDGHAVHVPIPVNDLLVPATQAVHTAPSLVPEKPALHVQADRMTDPAREPVPAGHKVHASILVEGL